MFGWEMSSLAFLAETEPPYYMRTLLETSSETFWVIHCLMKAWAASAISGVAVLPVPIAQIGS